MGRELLSIQQRMMLLRCEAADGHAPSSRMELRTLHRLADRELVRQDESRWLLTGSGWALLNKIRERMERRRFAGV
jgi:hypothetical protein